MEAIFPLGAFIIGLLFFSQPAFNNTFGHDAAAALSGLDQARKGHNIFYKQSIRSAPGNYLPLWIMLAFWDKFNSRAFYGVFAVYNALASVMLYLVAAHLYGAVPGLLAALMFSYYFSSPRMDGNWAPTEQLMALPLLGSIYFLLKTPESAGFIVPSLSGLLFGYGILVKQTAAAYAPGYLLMALGMGFSPGNLLSFFGGALLIQVVPAIYYWLKHNALMEYFVCIWLFFLPSYINPGKYNKFYPGHVTRGDDKVERRWKLLRHYAQTTPPLLLLALSGIVLSFFNEHYYFQLGILWCLVLSLAMIFMRGTYFGRTLLNAVPWLVLLSSLASAEVIAAAQSAPGAVLIAGIVLLYLAVQTVFQDRKFFIFSKDPYAFIRKTYGEPLVNTYKNWKKLGEYIRDRTGPEDRTLICGWLPHIQFYCERNSMPPEGCWYAADYLELYSREDISPYFALSKMFKLEKLLVKHPNPFGTGYPEIILFPDDATGIGEFERLGRIKYTRDTAIQGLVLYRANKELAELLDPLENPAQPDPDGTDGNIPVHREIASDLCAQNPEAAYAELKERIKHDPGDCRNILLLGDCMLRLDKPGLFFDFFTRLINGGYFAGADLSLILTKVGEGLLHCGNVTQAGQTFRQALQLDPQNAQAGRLLESLKNQAAMKQPRAA